MELSQQRFSINNNPNKIPVRFKRYVKFYQGDAVKVLALTHISVERAWWGVLGGCRPLGLETRAPHHKTQVERCRLLTKYVAKDGSLFFCVVAQTGENHATGTSKAEQVSKTKNNVTAPPGLLYSAQIMCFTLMHECVGVCPVVSNPVIPWNIVQQGLLSMEFPRQEYWSGVPFPTPGDLLYVQLLLFRKTHL